MKVRWWEEGRKRRERRDEENGSNGKGYGEKTGQRKNKTVLFIVENFLTYGMRLTTKLVKSTFN